LGVSNFQIPSVRISELAATLPHVSIWDNRVLAREYDSKDHVVPNATITHLTTGVAPTGRGKPGRYNTERMDKELFRKQLEQEIDKMDSVLNAALETRPLTERRKDALDRATELIIEGIRKALFVSAPRASGKATGEPWWDESCREARDQLRHEQAQRTANLQLGIQHSDRTLRTLQGVLRRKVRAAKRNHFRKVIDELEGRDIFQAVKWPHTVRQ